LRSNRIPAVFFGSAILLSAFLLFQVQPLIAKLILPWFGGSAAVWTSCMLFFQLTLFGGYAYAAWLNRRTALTQRIVHLALLALSCLWLPILGLLAVTVGLPFFLLSSTSPLLQSWYSRSNGNAMPYRFFALSNAGSMIGLLTYPVLIEPWLTNRQQAWIWSISYGAFGVVCATVAWRTRGAHLEHAAVATAEIAAPRLQEFLLWVGLAACPSALLLAVTSHMTENIAAIPYLWVLPLSLYLLSFILTFESDRWFRRWLFAPLAAVSLPVIAWLISGSEKISDLRLLDIRSVIGLLSAAMFVLFMVCHGELARRRPPPAHLSSFYLMIAAGGAIGGLFVAVAAPYLFNALYDLPIVLSLTGFLFLYLLWTALAKRLSAERKRARTRVARFDRPVVFTLTGLMIVYIGARVLAGQFGEPLFLDAPYDTTILLVLTGCLAAQLLWSHRGSPEATLVLFTVVAGFAVGFAGILARETWKSFGYARLLSRNFYGSLVVYDDETPRPMGPVRVLRNGAIDHGEQFLWPQNRGFPTTYYARNSGVGRALAVLMAQGPINVGIVGLGAGTLAAYARAVDHYYLYEINPNVLKIATSQFTFLSDCPAPHVVVPGDARLSLERESARHFDLLALDAFSGDSIPIHLLTREAFELYWRHLKPDGVLAVHVSNKYLALSPVIAMAAAANGKQAMSISYGGNAAAEESSSDWVLVTSRRGFFDLPDLMHAERPIEPIPGLRMWTDDYSNLYQILR
jgi:SAM-dependent methyltransferase